MEANNLREVVEEVDRIRAQVAQIHADLKAAESRYKDATKASNEKLKQIQSFHCSHYLTKEMYDPIEGRHLGMECEICGAEFKR